MDTFRRDGKHPIDVGDHARVEGSDLERGWTCSVLRFASHPAGHVTAVVTAPDGRLGVRHIAADRLTKKH